MKICLGLVQDIRGESLGIESKCFKISLNIVELASSREMGPPFFAFGLPLAHQSLASVSLLMVAVDTKVYNNTANNGANGSPEDLPFQYRYKVRMNRSAGVV